MPVDSKPPDTSAFQAIKDKVMSDPAIVILRDSISNVPDGTGYVRSEQQILYLKDTLAFITSCVDSFIALNLEPMQELNQKIQFLEALVSDGKASPEDLLALKALQDEKAILDQANQENQISNLAAAAKADAEKKRGKEAMAEEVNKMSAQLNLTGASAAYSVVTLASGDISIPRYIDATRNLNMYARKRQSDIDLQKVLLVVDKELNVDRDAAIETVAKVIESLSDW